MQQCLTSVQWLVLEHVSWGGETQKTSDISLPKRSVDAFSESCPECFFCEISESKTKQLISVVVGYPQVFVELNYLLSNHFHCSLCLFTIVFISYAICSGPFGRRTTRSPLLSCIHF